MRPICSLLLALFSSLYISAQENAGDILKQYYKAIKSHESISYDSKFYFRGFKRTDTLRYKAEVNLLRVAADSGFGGMIWLGHGNKYTFYNLRKVYNVDKYLMLAKAVHQSDGSYIDERGPTRVFVKGKGEGKNYPYYLGAGEFYNACVWYEFLRPDLFKKYINAGTVKRLEDTAVDGKDCYEIFVKHLPKDHLDYEWANILYINKEDLMVVMNRYWSKNGEDTESTLRIFDNYIFDEVKKSRFSKKQIPDSYEIKE